MTSRRHLAVLACVFGCFAFLSLSSLAEAPPSGSLAFQSAGTYGTARTFQVTLGDLDGDGDLDAVFANVPGRSKVWMNDGNGGFTSVYQNIGSESRGIELDDLDGDGDGDLDAGIYYPLSHRQSRLYLNDGHGVLMEVSGFWLPRLAT